MEPIRACQNRNHRTHNERPTDFLNRHAGRFLFSITLSGDPGPVLWLR